MIVSRRRFLGQSAALLVAGDDPVAAYRTPYKYPELVLKATGNKGDFDALAVDDPIVFRANDEFKMLYIGYDGTGYQTGLATSEDMVRWSHRRLVGPRDAGSAKARF